jgi:23S rRNA pseudouridine1911/1915/1917 synthase
MRDCLQSAILGDVIYGNPPRQNVKTPRLMLHAWRLAFQHPITHQPLSFCAPVPVEYEPWLPDASVLESAAASATAAKA